jgi:hypothetical protein
MVVECAICKALVQVDEIARHPEVDRVTGKPMEAVFAKCTSCNSPLLLIEYTSSSESDTELQYHRYRVYPPDRRASYALPEKLRNTFNEAIACMKANCQTASIIMCRKTLEGICHHFLGSFKNLQSGLQALKDKGIIEAKIYDWSEYLRKNGNLAVHEANSELTEWDAEDVLDFTEAILDYVFVLHERFEGFKERQNEKEE